MLGPKRIVREENILEYFSHVHSPKQSSNVGESEEELCL